MTEDTNAAVARLDHLVQTQWGNLTPMLFSMIIDRQTAPNPAPAYPIFDLEEDEWIVPAGPVEVDENDLSTFLYFKNLSDGNQEIVCIYALRKDRPQADYDDWRDALLEDDTFRGWVKSFTMTPFFKATGN